MTIRLFAVALAALSSLLIYEPLLQAATITVNGSGDTAADDGVCTLREAIDAAVSNLPSGDTTGTPCTAGDDIDETITFNIAQTGPTITLTSGLFIQDDIGVTIQGPGAGSLTVDGNGTAGRVFAFDDGITSGSTAIFEISGLTITGGEGGVALTDGTSQLTLDGVAIIQNTLTGDGAGVLSDDSNGGTTGSPTLVVKNSTIKGNTSSANGGGIACFNGSTVTIENSTIAGNSSGANGGGILNSGGSAMTILKSTIFDNTTGISGTPTGGGIQNEGALSSLTITNSTLSDNQSDGDGGGINNTGDGTTTVTLLNVTITRNTADFDEGSVGDGGGISQADGAGPFTVTNSIIAGNFDSGGGGSVFPDCFTASDDASDVVSDGNNLIGDIVGCGDNTFDTDPTTLNDQVGDSGGLGLLDPLLAALDPADGGDPANGGLTGIHSPTDDSTAIDGVDESIAAAPGEDQRGTTRPVGTTSDIGAVEVFCGDSVIQSGETCDNGASNSDTTADACRTTCVSAACSDGVIDTGEECDDGASNDDTAADACRTACVNPACGDGATDTGEGCDDGNTTDGDGCSAACAVETDTDGDGILDNVDTDDDGDGIDDADDNCPLVANDDQTDTDEDGTGDACDDDDDADGIADADDNCPLDDNADQEDADEDGIGDACEEGGGCSLIR